MLQGPSLDFYMEMVVQYLITAQTLVVINYMKKKLIVLVSIEIILIVLYVFSRSFNVGQLEEWLYWLTLVFGVYAFLFAFSIKCSNPSCKRRQVFKGLSIIDIRLPGNKCYYCGTNLDIKK